MKYLNLLYALLVLVLTACGGGSSGSNNGDPLLGDVPGIGDPLAEGGIGGTGISQGPVTGFGSIFVNGIKYEVNAAEFVRNGRSMFSQSDFSIGEFVTIKGSVNADGVTGVAEKVVFSDLLGGPVTEISTDNESIIVMGQTVITDQLTVLLKLVLLTDLKAGDLVEVSGYRNAGSAIVATSIKHILTTDSYRVTGIIDALDSTFRTFRISGLTVDYSAVSPELEAVLENGDLVEVEATNVLVENRLQATTLSTNKDLLLANVEEAEIEGLITRYISSGEFDVNGIPVLTSANTEFEHKTQSQLALNVKVEVEGRINAAGLLIAEKVELRESNESIELEALIQGINGSQLIVQGNTVTTNNSTIFLDDDDDASTQLRISDLVVGDFVEVKGNRLADGSILATRIDREKTESEDEEEGKEIELEDHVTAFDSSANTFVILGFSVQINDATEIESEDNDLSVAEFFNRLQAGDTRIKVKGVSNELSGVIATEIEFDD